MKKRMIARRADGRPAYKIINVRPYRSPYPSMRDWLKRPRAPSLWQTLFRSFS